jgi:hypothetical protein
MMCFALHWERALKGEVLDHTLDWLGRLAGPDMEMPCPEVNSFKNQTRYDSRTGLHTGLANKLI